MVMICTLIGLIVGVTIIGAGYIRGEVTREYRVSTSVAVISTGTSKDYSTSSPDQTNLQVSRNLVDSVIYVIKSRRNMEAVIADAGLNGVSPNDISRNLTVNRNGETEIIEITLLWRSEKEGLTIVNSINRVTSSVMKDTVKIGTLSVINEPTVSFIVGGHINLSVWIYAAVVGLLVGIGVCILKFALTPTMINEDDITEIFGIDTLGSLPLDSHYARLKPNTPTDLPIMDDIKSSAHLLISHLEGAGVHKLYVTSTKHDEGKTRLIADIGLQFARLGKKTLIVDCNFQNPMLGRLFIGHLSYEKTLNALYRGDADKLDAVTRINGCLDLLPCVLERNPENFNDALLMELKNVMEGYDYVLIDTAPVGIDAEVLRLNEVTDTVLYIVRFDHAKVDEIKRSMLRIAKSGIPVVGAIFNCVINWRQTIINTPKRLANSLRREEKRVKKEEKKRLSYHEKREKANKKAPRRRTGTSLEEEYSELMKAPEGESKPSRKPKKSRAKDHPPAEEYPRRNTSSADEYPPPDEYTLPDPSPADDYPPPDEYTLPDPSPVDEYPPADEYTLPDPPPAQRHKPRKTSRADRRKSRAPSPTDEYLPLDAPSIDEYPELDAPTEPPQDPKKNKRGFFGRN